MKQDVVATIREQLSAIEDSNQVRVFFACESGSRAWGFESPDSDYDVRFLYVHPIDWYLSIDVVRRRDVIEIPIDGDLDINGWDLRKALSLMYKSNPPLMEWLGSPIVYSEHPTIANRLRELTAAFFQPRAAAHHYLHMAQGNYREFLKLDRVKLKKYFYVLRPVLAVRWLERDLGVVPTPFQELLEATDLPNGVRAEIDELLAKKSVTSELGDGPRIEPLNAFIDVELARHEANPLEIAPRKSDAKTLNDFFRTTIDEIWRETTSTYPDTPPM